LYNHTTSYISQITTFIGLYWTKSKVSIHDVRDEAWNTAQNTEVKREEIQALSLAKECYSMNLDLLTNVTVVDDAIRFVSTNSKDKEKMESLDSNGKEKSNEPDYIEDQDQLEEEQKEIIGETRVTTNQVF
jgi:hypothetical protein